MIEGLIGALAGAAMAWAGFSALLRKANKRADLAEAKAKYQSQRAEKHLACAVLWEDYYRTELARSQRLLATTDALRLALRRWTADQDCRVEGGTFSRN